jgi:hypothetical protein
VSTAAPSLAAFVRGEVPAEKFPHAEHVRLGFEMLSAYDFAESVLHFSRALRTMTAGAGKPQAFNQTITVAFLALIAQRRLANPGDDFADFARRHPELFDRGLLLRWYTHEQLHSPQAREAFLLPGP